MTFLSDPESSTLFIAATRCYLTLAKITTKAYSQKRYELLWELVSSDIVGGAWVYGTRSVEMMEASVEALVPIVAELGISSVRFLKVNHSRIRIVGPFAHLSGHPRDGSRRLSPNCPTSL